jgi:hypothetical protein
MEQLQNVHGKNGVHGGNAEVTAAIGICKASVGRYLVSEGKINKSPTAMVGHVMIEDSCDAVLPEC